MPLVEVLKLSEMELRNYEIYIKNVSNKVKK